MIVLLLKELLEIDHSKFVNENKYIFVAETNDNGDLVSRNITAATEIVETISLIITLKLIWHLHNLLVQI